MAQYTRSSVWDGSILLISEIRRHVDEETSVGGVAEVSFRVFSMRSSVAVDRMCLVVTEEEGGQIFWVDGTLIREVEAGLLGDCLGWLVWQRRLLVSVERNHRGCRVSKTTIISSSNILMITRVRISGAAKDLFSERGRITGRLVLAGYSSRYFSHLLSFVVNYMLISIQKVLYLMVVNMPTEEEFAQARELSREWDMRS